MEKLKWMTNMPKPRPLKNNEGFIARFSFEGNILPYDSDISYREGLHHHGEEPGMLKVYICVFNDHIMVSVC